MPLDERDRPGWGLSAPMDFKGHADKTAVAELLRQTLDELGIDQVHLAQAHPSEWNVWFFWAAGR